MFKLSNRQVRINVFANRNIMFIRRPRPMQGGARKGRRWKKRGPLPTGHVTTTTTRTTTTTTTTQQQQQEQQQQQRQQQQEEQ